MYLGSRKPKKETKNFCRKNPSSDLPLKRGKDLDRYQEETAQKGAPGRDELRGEKKR